MDERRQARSDALFRRVLKGEEHVPNVHRARLFLEAICAQSDHAACIARLVGSPAGISALRQAFRLDVSQDYLNQSACPVLQYLQDPQLEVVCNGDLLHRVIQALVDPPIFWDALADAARTNLLTPESLHCFAWLLLRLVNLPEPASKPYANLALSDTIQQALQRSTKVDSRNLYQKIVHVISTVTVPTVQQGSVPGGRHDNDFTDFRQIQILPTVDELASSEPPFLRFAREVDEANPESRLAMHLDNQFRLLREDMLHDLRENLQTTLKPVKGRSKGQVIDGLRLVGVEWDQKCRQRWALEFECTKGLWMLPKENASKREQFLKDHRKVLANESLACLIADGNLVGLSLIWRKESSLAQIPSRLHLHLPESEVAVKRTLMELRTASSIKMVQLSTATFAYQPILQQLQNAKLLPLANRIMTWNSKDATLGADHKDLSALTDLAAALTSNASMDLQSILSLPKPTKLDSCQAESLKASLTQEVAIVQGPPGTGKSFIGALITKAMHLLTKCKILVLSYTNHALDQFLEDLMDVGIKSGDIVRLGSPRKASDKTKSLALSEHRGPQYNLTRHHWEVIESDVADGIAIGIELADSLQSFNVRSAKRSELIEYLEFSAEFDKFFDAFMVHAPEDGFQVVAKDGNSVGRFYLLDRWANGLDAGVLAARTTRDAVAKVWSLTKIQRQTLLKRWLEDIFKERLDSFYEYSRRYNDIVAKVKTTFGEKDRRVMTEKRIIGCTTTAAAKYVDCIQAARPDVVVVEEAGEILESHIITAIGPDTKQLILIGDHKQLRPKAHYHLSVEKGMGYDLNRSLFERLVNDEYPHQTLSKQHRMRPEISTLVRSLTYPELTDAATTKNRPQMRGFQSSVIFVNHAVAERNVANVYDPREGGSSSSKNNWFEAEMTLKCVKYLAQQGYRSSQLVVLTPYLGQLRLLLEVLGRENDPVLNDMDTYDLVRAGLVPAATASVRKGQLRISTIDNYQGEESDIVVVSLTRSNSEGDIGFLNSPERLNVLLSRAREGLILIGNADTFLRARKGRELWEKFLAMLKHESHVFDGFPVRCERHPGRQALISKPEEFDAICPEGGCEEPCQTLLQCGKHKCPHKCHQLYDHSKMRCEQVETDKCAADHVLSYRCFMKTPPACKTCERKKARDEKKRNADLLRQQEEVAAKVQHEQMMEALEDQIEQHRQAAQRSAVADERRNAYEQKHRDLENVKTLTSNRTQTNSMSPAPSKVSSAKPGTPPSIPRSNHVQATNSSSQTKGSPIPESKAELEWRRKKNTENYSNDALDELMKMTGLEQVKSKFLSILEKLDTARRQNTSLKEERLGIVLLGNPGTGKTTVARHYAKFLSLLDVLPGTKFVETTGAKLANDGVAGTKKLLESVLQAGGGAFFIDEAYQLTSGNSYAGTAVLDYLLAEIENTTGKVVFVFAGYEKQMEKFFMHNPGLDSRIPNRLHFRDYSEAELRLMLQRKIEKKWNGNMSIEDGPEGLYMRIVTRRLHRQSGQEGFGNARALENLLDRIKTSQSSRLTSERRAGLKPDDFHLTKTDIIGPEPSKALSISTAWQKLQEMIGLDTVKQSVRSLLDRLQDNYKRELKELQPIEVSLNRLFLGSPGTGKTTVAGLYGQILAEIGLLSSAECVMKTPADFIGSVIGESERNTKSILESTKGKVLVIDEAYMFHTATGSGPNSKTDSYRTAIVDTIVSEVQSTPGEDRAVLLLGYREQMETMLRKVNPGLARRFPIDSAFNFEDYDDDELLKILDLKLNKQGLVASSEAKMTAISVLAKSRRRVNFGNAGEVENLLSRAKESFSKRQQSVPAEQRTGDVSFEPQDFDPDFARSDNAVANCKELFKDVIGCEEVVAKLIGYVQIAENARKLEMDPEKVIPFTFLFKGPPGTGKTTTARKIGRIFCDMGFLSSDTVIECSATNLVGEYIGQTGPKVIQKFEEALGQVLFIDEAYRLGKGQFNKEAIDEIVDCLTKTRFKGKMIVILAGYSDEINNLIRANPGLSSRFREEINFKNLTPEKCLELLVQKCQQEPKARIPMSVGSPEARTAVDLFRDLIALPGWGNGRDVETLSQRIISHVLSTRATGSTHLEVTNADMIQQLKRLKDEQRARAVCQTTRSDNVPRETLPTASSSISPTLQPPTMSSGTETTSKSTDALTDPERPREAKYEGEEAKETGDQQSTDAQTPQRDPGVPDRVWQQLQLDAQQNARHRNQAERAIANSKAQQQALALKAQRLEAELKRLEEKARAEAAAASQVEYDEAQRRRHEQIRLQAVAAQRRAEEEARRLQKLRDEAERQRQQEVKAQQKLKSMGVCPVGYRWIRQGSGYRCAGGSHFVGHEQLGL